MLEARGDRKGAAERYRAVARFGQMIGSARAGGFMMRQRLQEAYQRLGALYQKKGIPIKPSSMPTSAGRWIKQTKKNALPFRRE